MQTFRQRMFLMFGLRRNTASATKTRRTPAALQVDRHDKVVPLRQAKAAPKPALRIGTEVRDGGMQYIKVFANEPRTA